LDKYNEELNGEKKKSFKLGTNHDLNEKTLILIYHNSYLNLKKGTRGQYDASDDRFIEKLNQEHKARAIKIDALNELKFATDYMTQQEMVCLFFKVFDHKKDCIKRSFFRFNY